ncbi:MAG: polysaccharide deacetylase family protein [Planctomycetota bacterium]|jgi:peptidoglycan/xylan/chitin deacetylase (PgdA/CDA1 family)
MSVYGQRGPLVRVAYLLVAVVWWLLTGRGRWGRARVVTLCYHGVKPQERERFRRQMSSIAGRAITVTDMGTAERQPRSLPRVCVTFDDAFANLLDNALPVTRALDIPVTVFAVTDNLGSRPAWKIAADCPDASEATMTARQVVEAAGDPGVTFGSHSATHRTLAELPLSEARDELARSKATLEELLERPVEDLAFPYGASHPAVVSAAFAAGYRRVFSLEPPVGHNGSDNPGAVFGRMRMTPDAWPIEHMLTTAGAYGWLPPVRRLLRRARRTLGRPLPRS